MGDDFGVMDGGEDCAGECRGGEAGGQGAGFEDGGGEDQPGQQGRGPGPEGVGGFDGAIGAASFLERAVPVSLQEDW